MNRLLIAALALALVLLAVATTALVYTRRDVTRLSAQVEELSSELAEARAAAEETEQAAPDLLDGLLGEGFADLFGGLLGGGQGADLAACVTDGLTQAEPIAAGDTQQQIAAIVERVEQERELERGAELDVTVLSSADIEQRVTGLVLEDYPAEEADLDRRLLSALGAIPADLDLRSAQAELVSSQVAGFYDTDSGELVVRSDDPAQPLGPAQQVTLAHEVEHAIADQVLGLDVEEDDQQTDAARAALAVVEGDATLVMQRFSAGALDLTQQLALATDPAVAGAQAQIEGYPHALTAPLLFSYTDGLGFVCDRYAEGGWDAVDAAYEQRPQTTAEILFPDRYPASAASPPSVGQPGGRWRQARSDTFGAADLLWLFEAPGDREEAALEDARDRAGDWTGGGYTLHTDGDATAVGIGLVGDPRLCDSLTSWYDAAFPDAADLAEREGATLARSAAGQTTVLACDGDTVRLGIAPDAATAHALAGGG